MSTSRSSALKMRQVGWVVTGALLVRLCTLAAFSQTPWFIPQNSDAAFYHEWAQRLLTGGFADGEAFYGLPGYPFLTGLLYMAAGITPLWPGILNAAADAGTAVVILLLIWEIFPEHAARVAGPAAACAWIFLLPAQAYSALVMPVAPGIFCFWASLLWAVRTAQEPGPAPRVQLLQGLFIGVIATMVATVLAAIPVLAASAIWSGRKRFGRMAAALCLLAAGVAAGTSPVWIYNNFVAKEPVFLSAHSGLNFYAGNFSEASGYPRMPQGLRAGQKAMLSDSIAVAERSAGRKLAKHEVSAWWKQRALEEIRLDPARWLALLLQKAGNFWSAFVYDDIGVLPLFERHLLLLPTLKTGLIAAAALPGLLILPWRCRRSMWVVAGVLLTMLILLPVFITERYRLPAMPGLIICAAGTIWLFVSSIVNGRWLHTAGCSCAVLAAAFLVSNPPSDRSLWALAPYNLAVKELQAGNAEQALADLEDAAHRAPYDDAIWLASGNAAIALGQNDAAKRAYRRALEINPRNERAWNNLGLIAVQSGHWQLAQQFLLRSLALDNDDAGAWHLLSQARREAGDLTGASQAAERAAALAPDVVAQDSTAAR